MALSSNGSSWDIANDVNVGSPTLNQWVHWAFVRNGNTFTSYNNGVSQATFTSSLALLDGGAPWIGYSKAGERYWNGYLDELRISKGVARWTSNFTPPTTPYGGIAGIPSAIAGTSLDGDNKLQLDGTLSSDPDNKPLTFSWSIEGDLNSPRLGQIVSIADITVGTYTTTLTVSNGVNSATDTMLFGVPQDFGVVEPTPDELQQATNAVKDIITSFSANSFDAPNDKARENRRKALLNMLDKIYDAIGVEDFQASVDQLRDILSKSDGLEPPDSPPDWILGTDGAEVFSSVSSLINDLLAACGECG